MTEGLEMEKTELDVVNKLLSSLEQNIFKNYSKTDALTYLLKYLFKDKINSE